MGLFDRLFGTKKSPPGGATTTSGTRGATTFNVSNVRTATEPLPEVPYHQAVAAFLDSPIESCSRYHGQLVANVRSHPLIGALHAAFATHRPICLSPDVIWLTLTQGLAHHINANAEQLRHHFVQHEGKLVVVVERDDFAKGSPENTWPEVFAEFSSRIREHIGDAHGLIVADFSTTGPVERAASEVVLLDAMQAFFSYEVHTLCGIPSITLEGTVEDWEAIARRVREFRRFDLAWWIEPLQPIVDQFVEAASGKVKRRFWDSIYKWQGPRGSGSPQVTGWIFTLFPYLNNPQAKYGGMFGGTTSAPPLHRNPWLGAFSSRHGPGRDAFPSLPPRAPFLWRHLGTDYAMEFIGGLIGVYQDPQTLCLRPEIGWVIREARAVRGGAGGDDFRFDYL
jgi:hypothetical protein